MNSHVIIGEIGVVYRGYIRSEEGSKLVAIKTCRGMALETKITFQSWSYYFLNLALAPISDKNKLLEEVRTMLSLKHPNVISLIGVCLDGEIPLLIMPLMSNGSVLEYVKQNKEDLYISNTEDEERVSSYFLPSILI